MLEISDFPDFRDISRGCGRFLAEGICPEPLKTDYIVFEHPRILLGALNTPGKLTSQGAEVHLQVPFLNAHFL